MTSVGGDKVKREVTEEELWEKIEMCLDIIRETKSAKMPPPPTEEEKIICVHKLRENYEIGIYCVKCGIVETEAKYIFPAVESCPLMFYFYLSNCSRAKCGIVEKMIHTPQKNRFHKPIKKNLCQDLENYSYTHKIMSKFII